MARVTPQLARRIDGLRAAGASKASILRALEADGTPINFRTLAKYLAQQPAADGRLDVAATAPAGTTSGTAEDDLARLVRRRDAVERALDQWGGLMASDAAAVRAHGHLTRELGDLTARLIELRPKADDERNRLVELGEEARAELLARASTDDVAVLRAQLATKERMIAALLDADNADEGNSGTE